ncbi:MAG: phosphatidylglycerol lysyltransferase domain-containing protein [bacterium]
MIPQFPEFKKLELSDRDEIESFTKKFPPYSDFNFISMWSWDIKGEMKVAWFNGNLVVKFTDYLTGEPFYSFLGTNKVNETAAALIEISKILGQKHSICLIPETIATLLDPREFIIKEEPDHFDYIYDLAVVSKMEEEIFERKRRYIKSFLENDSFYRTLDLSDSDALSMIEEVNQTWIKNKVTINANFEYKNEFIALGRFLNSRSFKNVVATFLLIENKPVAYAIYEEDLNGYIISHFEKADFSYKGINDYFLQQDCAFFLEKGFHLMNIEQDLGIPGLKQSKKSFSTGMYLKKYSIMLK